MTSFPDFWTFLETDSPQWWDFTKMRFFAKDLKKCAMDCYAYMLADEKLLNMDGPGKRKYFVAWLMKAPDAPVKIQMTTEEPFKESENFLTGEAREKRIKEVLAIINASPGLKPTPRMSRKEFEENGGWEPKKEAPYPFTNEAELKAKDKHFRYILANYDTRTKERLPDWMEETKWNELND